MVVETASYMINVFAAILLLFLGIACILTQRNMIKAIIGLEIMSKGVLLSFIATGIGLAEALVVILILIDAVLVAVAMSIVIAAYRHYGSLDIEKLTELRW